MNMPHEYFFSCRCLANFCPLFEHMWQVTLWLSGPISLIKQVCLVSKPKEKQPAYLFFLFYTYSYSNCSFLVLWSKVVAKRLWKLLQVFSTASYSDKRPLSTFASTLLFVFPRRKSPIQIVSANSRQWILSKLAKVPEKCVSAQDGNSLQLVIPPNVSICRGNGLLCRRDVA